MSNHLPPPKIAVMKKEEEGRVKSEEEQVCVCVSLREETPPVFLCVI